MASDGARTARLVALIAGHGFVFTRVREIFAEIIKNQTTPHWVDWLLIIAPLVGIIATYLALRAEPDSRTAKVGENISALLLAAFLVIFVVGTGAVLGIIRPI